jgi:hypothetical protein
MSHGDIKQQSCVIQVGTDGSLILVAKAFVDILIHEGSLTDPRKGKGM